MGDDLFMMIHSQSTFMNMKIFTSPPYKPDEGCTTKDFERIFFFISIKTAKKKTALEKAKPS